MKRRLWRGVLGLGNVSRVFKKQEEGEQGLLWRTTDGVRNLKGVGDGLQLGLGGS